MPQINKFPTYDHFNKGVEVTKGLLIEHENIAVAQAGLTELTIVPTILFDRIFVQIQVVDQSLDQFVISGRASSKAPWSQLYATSADYDTPRGIIIGVSGDLSTLGAGETGDITLDVRGFYELRFEASSSHAAGSVVSVFGGAA